MESISPVLLIVLVIGVYFAAAFLAGVMEGMTRSSIPLECSYMFKYKAAGKEVICSHCKGDSFVAKQVLLNSTIATLIGMDWANRHATLLRCMDCGQIVWFSQKPTKAEDA